MEVSEKMDEDGLSFLITRLQITKMPFFEEAKDEFYKTQPPYDMFLEELAFAGLKAEIKKRNF